MLIAEQFIQSLARKYGKHPVSTDGDTWYPQACKFLKLKHHIHLLYEKSIIERTIQYIKDRTECLMTIFLAEVREEDVNILNWFKMFIDMHNRSIIYTHAK